MKEIDELLNRIGDYSCIICEEEISLIGMLRRENNNIVFQSHRIFQKTSYVKK